MKNTILKSLAFISILSMSPQLLAGEIDHVEITIGDADKSVSRINYTTPSGLYKVTRVKTFFKKAQKAEFKTTITQGDKVISEILGASLMTMHPTRDIICLSETAQDDDTQQYLLNLEGKEFTKKGNRLQYVFGGRFVNKASWSADGKSVILHYAPGLAPEDAKDNMKSWLISDLLKQEKLFVKKGVKKPTPAKF